MDLVPSNSDLEDASSGSSSSEEQPTPVRTTPEASVAQVERVDALVATDVAEDTLKSKITSKARAKSMIRLQAALTPDLTEPMEAELLAGCSRRYHSRYRNAKEQDAKDTAQWDAQNHVARNIFGTLKTHE